MIVAIGSRENANWTMVFAQGRYEFGLLDAGLAGTATLQIQESASGHDPDIIKPGAFVHIYPQHGFDHWYGLVTGVPTHIRMGSVYEINALELTGFLGDIQNIASFFPLLGSGDPAAPDDDGSGRWWI